MKSISLRFALPFLLLVAGACSPKVYVIDRQSVLEEEAAGRWPDFDKMIMANSTETTATPLPIAAESDRSKKRLQILNGPFLESPIPGGNGAETSPNAKGRAAESGKPRINGLSGADSHTRAQATDTQ